MIFKNTFWIYNPICIKKNFITPVVYNNSDKDLNKF